MRAIALLTDFGLTDPYVGQLHAALTRLAPGAPLIDISHQVEPFGTAQAAFFLAASAPHFPRDTVFMCVVDPRVGTSRKILGVQAGSQSFLAPDGGLLDLLLDTPGLPPARIYDLAGAATDYGHSATFHGRDIFSPLAARLSAGEAMETLGSPLTREDVMRQTWAKPQVEDGGVLAHVLHVDHFGNCVLSLRQGFPFAEEVAGLSLAPGESMPLRRVRAYAELGLGEPGLLLGSQGFYELAAFQDSASMRLTLSPGDPVRILFARGLELLKV
ncbi:MAG: SAM-dependent chlorinase/fluorinase [Humidesulfovibrio sp.]|uniref:SAM hydrolase/SAM-dependent halogenase family protein n=1 Tax=Humidesulfovibrio sp. TaxID=2910988 RepID=UPI0027EB57FC|nr:SAM-dependent chlorinase/fluorinase [Humidesulfovibrio sp.]MDQ7836319.1 SAM-dependent chlorinase/fluorinase [Humidesulfovibrio sp.]